MAISLNQKYKPEDRHKAVVEHGKGVLVVFAGPGTGKTFSLLQKIESLLNLGVDPRQIYYLTFVNSIVDAFKKDVEKDPEEGGLGTSAEELGINISTLHSLAFKIVKTYSVELGLPQYLELVDFSTKAIDPLSRIFIGDLYLEAKAKLGYAKKEFAKDLDELQNYWRNNTKVDASLTNLYKIVIKFTKRYHTLPWDLLVPLANNAVEKHGLPKWLRGAQHFLIDEFQDFNPAEQQFIERVTEPCDSVVIVGDADQSIYSGRSASPKGFQSLLDGKDVATVNFVYCRRCPQNIIKAANAILQRMCPTEFESKKLLAYKDRNGEVTLKIEKSCKAEIDFIAKQIKEWQKRGLFKIVILFPTRRGIPYYQEQLEKRGIGCQVSRGDVQGETLKAYLRLAIYGSHPMLERLLVAEFTNLNRRCGLDVLPIFINKSLTFAQALKKAADQNNWRKVVHSEYECFLSELSALASNESKKIVSFLKKRGFNVEIGTINDLLNTSVDVNILEQINSVADKILQKTEKEEVSTKGSVRLLTMHSSKGLSEEVVVMPAFEDKWLPGNSKDEELAEKHRLFYVALTRSGAEVLITYPKTRARKDPLCFSPHNTKEGISRYAKLIEKTCNVMY